VIAQEKNGRPFGIDALRPIQMSRADVLDTLFEGRSKFEIPNDWIDFVVRSVGFEPAEFDERARRVALLRMVPFAERNYNLVELGAAQARAISFSKYRLTHTLFPGARQPWLECS
jgi:ATP-dependent Lon protease